MRITKAGLPLSKYIYRLLFLIFLVFGASPLLSGCVPYIIGGNYGRPPAYYPPQHISNSVEVGIASWYGPGFQGRPTASGTIYNMYDLTAASKVLPLNSYAYVTDLGNHRSVEVLVNDRGPYVGDRIMDLSYAAAKAIDMVGPGTALVRIQYLGPRPVEEAAAAVNYPTYAAGYAGKNKARKFVAPLSGYTLQFAAYTKKRKAVEDIGELKKFVPGVHLATKSVGGTFYYKVVFGRFKNLQDAYSFAKTISRYGYDIYITKIE